METNTNTNTTEVNNGTEVVENNDVKTYTQEEVDALLQAESDRRVTSALQKQARKNEEKLREAEKLAQMNEEEKYRYQLDQREKAIADKERELTLAENKAAAIQVLADKGLATSLVQFVLAEDADEMKANIDLLDRAFRNSVRAEVEKRLSSKAPSRSNNGTSFSKQDFNKLSLAEQQRMYAEDPELVNSFMN